MRQSDLSITRVVPNRPLGRPPYRPTRRCERSSGAKKAGTSRRRNPLRRSALRKEVSQNASQRPYSTRTSRSGYHKSCVVRELRAVRFPRLKSRGPIEEARMPLGKTPASTFPRLKSRGPIEEIARQAREAGEMERFRG